MSQTNIDSNLSGPLALLGFVASYRRKVKDGSRYDHLIPPSSGTYEIIHPNTTVRHTVDEMDKLVRATLNDTKKLAPTLKAATLVDTLRNIFDFWYNHCQYKLDKDGVEELRRPKRSWRDGQILARNQKTEPESGIDCDCFSIAVGSCLMNLGINYKFRITKYNAGWQHVYVVVPVPENPTQYYTIDCVLNHFNDEKSYTANFDHTMNSPSSLAGLPLARLGALGEAAIDVAAEKNYLLSGGHFTAFDADNLGSVDTEDRLLHAIYTHLVATRNIISREPSSMEHSGGAANWLKLLNHAIKNWHTANRDAALDELEREEERWNLITEKNGSVSGFDGSQPMEFSFDGADDSAIEGLSGIGKLSVKKTGKTFFKNVKKATQAVKKVGAAVKKGAKNAAATIKKVGNVVKKFIIRANPLTLAMRAGYLLAMKINLFQWAQRVYPAYFTLAEAQKMGITPAAYALSQKGRAVMESQFSKIGGNPQKLEHYILTGRGAKQVKKHAGLKGFDSNESLGFAVDALITAAVPALIATSGALVKSGMTNKAYAKAQAQHDNAVTERARIAAQAAAANQFTNGFGDTDTTTDTTTDTSSTDVEAPEDVTESDASSPKGGGFKKFITMIKSWFSHKKNAGDPVTDTGSDILKDQQTEAAQPVIPAVSKITQSPAYKYAKAQQAKALAAGKTVAQAIETGKQAYLNAGGASADTYAAETQADNAASSSDASTDSSSAATTTTTTDDTSANDAAATSGGGIMDMIKANPGKTAIGVLITGAALTLALSAKARKMIGIGSKPKPKALLNGLGKTTSKKHKKHKTKKSKPRKTAVKRVFLK